MGPISCVINIRARHSQLQKDLIYSDWLPSIELSDSLRLNRDTKQKDTDIETIVLHVQMGEFHSNPIWNCQKLGDFCPPWHVRYR